MSELWLQTVPACTPERFVRLGTGLLERLEADPSQPPILLVAQLEGAAILLGRHQRASSALDLEKVSDREVLRRVGGGRTVSVSGGTVGIYLALPRIGTLLSAPVGADKLINRYVRGLNAGLTLAGASRGVQWFGRDFLSADSRQLGRVSQDGLPEGPALLEAFVAWNDPILLSRDLVGYPDHEDPRAEGPAPVGLAEWLGDDAALETIASRIAGGFERAYGCSIIAHEGPLPEGGAPLPAAFEEEAGFEDSGFADVPIGFVEALVKHDGSRLLEVRLRGDFIAPAFVLRDLEAQLVGCDLDFTSIGKKIDQAFARPGATVLGLRSLRVLADAILAAAGRLG